MYFLQLNFNSARFPHGRCQGLPSASTSMYGCVCREVDGSGNRVQLKDRYMMKLQGKLPPPSILTRQQAHAQT